MRVTKEIDCIVLEYLGIGCVGGQCAVVQVTQEGDALVVAPEEVTRGGQGVVIDGLTLE